MASKSHTTAASPVRRSHGQAAERLTYLAKVYSDGVTRLEWHELGEGVCVVGRDPGPDGIALDDLEASRRHAEISYVAASGVHRIRDLGSRNHTHLNGEVIDSDYLTHGCVLRIGSTLFVYVSLSSAGVDGLVAEGPVALARRRAEALVDLAAPSALPILVHGPSGAGKELLARRAHEKSGRAGRFVAVNCATFSRELLASELFGHVGGAFSGASGNRSGLFVSADGGTIFLDEIAELPLEQQPALLRVLQEGRVRPVGSDREVAVDVRVVSATHQDLAALARVGRFRPDLLARLAGFRVDLPPLAERKEEALELFEIFAGADAPPLTPEAAEALLLYAWPLNIRELKHAAERAALLSRGRRTIEPSALPPELFDEPAAPDAPAAPSDGDEDRAPSKDELEALLTTHEGNIALVARALGKHRQQVYRWLKRHALDATRFRGPSDG